MDAIFDIDGTLADARHRLHFIKAMSIMAVIATSTQKHRRAR